MTIRTSVALSNWARNFDTIDASKKDILINDFSDIKRTINKLINETNAVLVFKNSLGENNSHVIIRHCLAVKYHKQLLHGFRTEHGILACKIKRMKLISIHTHQWNHIMIECCFVDMDSVFEEHKGNVINCYNRKHKEEMGIINDHMSVYIFLKHSPFFKIPLAEDHKLTGYNFSQFDSLIHQHQILYTKD